MTSLCGQDRSAKFKHLLEQKIETPFQEKWLTKLLGYDFQAKYKKGKDNKVADALSRKEKVMREVALISISISMANWIDDLKTSYMELVQNMIRKFTAG